MRKIACDSCGKVIEGRILRLTILADAAVLSLERDFDGRIRQVGTPRDFCSDECLTEPGTRHASEIESGLDLIEARARTGDLPHDEAEYQTMEILAQLRSAREAT